MTDQICRTLSVETLQALIDAILELVPEEATPRVIVVKSEVAVPTPIRPNGTKSSGSAAVYDPAFVCLAELSTLLAIRDADTVRTLGKQVAEVLQSAVRDSNRLHPIAVSRLSYYLLNLLKASNDHDFLRAPVVLHHIASLKPDVLKQSAQHVLKGVFECINGPRGLRNEMTASPDFWTLLHSLREFPDGAPLAFRTIEDIISGPSPAITADNFEPAVALLNAFANAGAEMVMKEQKQGQQPNRRGRQQPMPPPSPALEKPARSDVVVRGMQSMNLIQPLINKVPVLVEQSHLEKSQAWQTYWQPILRVVSTQCSNPCRDIRQAAFSSLHRCLFAPGLASEKHMEWTAIFNGVLFPLVQELLKTDPANPEPVLSSTVEMRIQTAQLVCKTFLHYLNLLYSNWDGIVPLWRDILAAMDRLMKSAGRGSGASELVCLSHSPLPPFPADIEAFANYRTARSHSRVSEERPSRHGQRRHPPAPTTCVVGCA